MRTINVVVEDEEWEALNKAKGEERNWHDFLMLLMNIKVKKDGKKSD